WLMMSLWDALRMNMMISYQELVRTFPSFSGRVVRCILPHETGVSRPAIGHYSLLFSSVYGNGAKMMNIGIEQHHTITSRA
ncbi:hypothetical protein POW16_09160, partial [Raoultella planticola]|uniref:hypothetical protein n=1 Tax=Raoultella planticola TaxID=575 RepID=UPI002FFC2BF2